MMFNATFNNISVISWRSVLLMEETGVPGENHQPVEGHWQTLSHNVVSSTIRTGSCKSKYHMIRLRRSITYVLFTYVFNVHLFDPYNASVSTSFRLHVGIVAIVWYFVFDFNFYLYEFPDNVHIYCVYTTVSCGVKLKTIPLVCVASRKSED